MRTSFAAITFLAGLVAANGGYGDYEPSTIVLTSTDVQTITSCAGGCEHTPSVSAPPVHTPEVTPSTAVLPTETPVLPETCVPTTVTVTVTVPAGPSGTPPVVPPVVPSVSSPPSPPHSSVSPPHPTSTVTPPVQPPTTPTPTPTPPIFDGAAGNVQAGVFVAGIGALAAFFL